MRYPKALLFAAVVTGLLLGAGCGGRVKPGDDQLLRAEKLARSVLFKDYCTSGKTEEMMQALMENGTVPEKFDVLGVPVERLAVSHEVVKRDAGTVVVFAFKFPDDALGKGALAEEKRTDVKVEIGVEKDGRVGFSSSY